MDKQPRGMAEVEQRDKKPHFLRKVLAGLVLIGVSGGFAGNYLIEDERLAAQQPLAEMPSPIQLGAPGLVCSFDKTDKPDACNADTALASFSSRPVVPVDIWDLNPAFRSILVAVEDKRFYEHNGFDKRAFKRAAFKNLLESAESRSLRFVEGASTIDRQVAGTAYPTGTEKNLRAAMGDQYGLLPLKFDPEVNKDDPQVKVAQQAYETRLAITMNIALRQEISKKPDLDKIDTSWCPVPDKVTCLIKSEIEEQYLNSVNFGRNAIGIGAASLAFYGIPAPQMTINQFARLVANLPGPSDSDINFSIPEILSDKAAQYHEFVNNNDVLSRDPDIQADRASKGLPPLQEIKYYQTDTNGNRVERLPEGVTELIQSRERARTALLEAQSLKLLDPPTVTEIAAYAQYLKESRYGNVRYQGVINKLSDQLTDDAEQKMRANVPTFIPFTPFAERNYTNASAMHARHIVDMGRAEAAAVTGKTVDELANGGYKIFMTMREGNQQAMSDMVNDQQPLKDISDLDMSAVNMRADGAVQALIGSKNQDQELNLATSAVDAGSRLKPFIVANALTEGWTLDTEVEITKTLEVPGANGSDALLIDTGQHCRTYGRPRVCKVEDGLATSDNIVAGRAAMKGGLNNVVRDMRSLGMNIREDWSSSIVLGTEVDNLELTQAYTGVALSQGKLVTPYFVAKVTTSDGRIVYEHVEPAQATPVYTSTVASDVTRAMTSVVRQGTAKGAILPIRGPESVAVKTGTGNESATLGVTGATCDPEFGDHTLSLTIAHTSKSSRIPDSAYSSSATVAKLMNQILRTEPHSTKSCSLVGTNN